MKPFSLCVEQCVEDLITRCPPLLRSPAFRAAVGFKTINLSETLKATRRCRGEAIWRVGLVDLDARDLSKFRSATPYSQPGGKADMSPTGVLTHEVGHFLWFAHRPAARLWHEGPWAASSERPITRYAASHYAEDFAETFRLFILNPDLLGRIAPIRVEAMHELLLDFGVRKMMGKIDSAKEFIHGHTTINGAPATRGVR